MKKHLCVLLTTLLLLSLFIPFAGALPVISTISYKPHKYCVLCLLLFIFLL